MRTRSTIHPGTSGLLLLIALVLAACGALKMKSWFGGRFTVEVRVAERVNQDSPVAVEILMVYNKKLLGKLAEFTAQEWFDQREQYRRDYREGKDFDAWHWEWVPGQRVPDQQLGFGAGVRGGLVFADYSTLGNPHRAAVDPHQHHLLLELGEDGFSIKAAGG